MKNIVIRLQRRGRFKKPCYNIVVMFKKSRVQGATLDKIGFYNPIFKNKLCFLSMERLAFWLYRGAIVSSKVQILIGRLSMGFKKGRRLKSMQNKKKNEGYLDSNKEYMSLYRKFFK